MAANRTRRKAPAANSISHRSSALYGGRASANGRGRRQPATPSLNGTPTATASLSPLPTGSTLLAPTQAPAKSPQHLQASAEPPLASLCLAPAIQFGESSSCVCSHLQTKPKLHTTRASPLSPSSLPSSPLPILPQASLHPRRQGNEHNQPHGSSGSGRLLGRLPPAHPRGSPPAGALVPQRPQAPRQLYRPRGSQTHQVKQYDDGGRAKQTSPLTRQPSQPHAKENESESQPHDPETIRIPTLYPAPHRSCPSISLTRASTLRRPGASSRRGPIALGSWWRAPKISSGACRGWGATCWWRWGSPRR